jgi:transcriptional regulator with XRE-family HTH domain
MSLTKLARRSGVSTATLCGLEAGRDNPTLATLQALAGVLGIPAGGLITEASQARTDSLGCTH